MIEILKESLKRWMASTVVEQESTKENTVIKIKDKRKKKSYVTPAIWQNRNRRIYLPTRTSRPLSTNKEKIHCKWNKSSIMTNSNAEEQKGENCIERMIGKMGD